MGNCLQSIFHITNGKQVTPRHQNLLYGSPSKQLHIFLKSSTLNDRNFYCAPNLLMMQQLLDSFFSNSMKIEQGVIKEHMNILREYIMLMRDKKSTVGKNYEKDKEKIKNYVQKQQMNKINTQIGDQGYKYEDALLVKIEVQIVMAACEELCHLTDNSKEYVYMICIFEQDVVHNQTKELTCVELISDEQKNSLKNSINRSSIGGISSNMKSTIATTDQPNQYPLEKGSPTKLKTSSKKQSTSLIQQFPIFQFINDVTYKNNRLIFKVVKSKRMTKRSGKQKQTDDRKVIGQSIIELNDLVFRDSLMVSDALPINQCIGNQFGVLPQKIGYLSIRAQAFSGDSFEKDYVKIIKYHEEILKQLGFLLEGEKGWEKLSQYKNSNESKRSIERSESMYSQLPSARVNRPYI